MSSDFSPGLCVPILREGSPHAASYRSGAGAIGVVRQECEAFGIIAARSVVEPLDDPFFTARRGQGGSDQSAQ